MSRFIESLEGRTLLSATATTLVTDLLAIVSADKTGKADFVTLEKGAATDLKAITADLKGSPKSNAPLLKTLKSDLTTAEKKIKADGGALLKATTLAKHSTADGVALTKKSSSKLIAKVQADITALGSATTTPLANLQSDSTGTGVGSDLTALTTANSTNTALATDATTMRTDLTTNGTTLVNDAQTYANDIATLKTDLSTLVA